MAQRKCSDGGGEGSVLLDEGRVSDEYESPWPRNGGVMAHASVLALLRCSSNSCGRVHGFACARGVLC